MDALEISRSGQTWRKTWWWWWRRWWWCRPTKLQQQLLVQQLQQQLPVRVELGFEPFAQPDHHPAQPLRQPPVEGWRASREHNARAQGDTHPLAKR